MKLRFLASALATFVLALGASGTSATLEKPFPARIDGREIRDEVDPADQQACYSMGQISLTYKSGEVGPPSVGLRITDPRGRRIGYDLRSDKGWQELPLAQGFFDCDENVDTSERRHCAGHIQICGPISGTYRVELLPAKRGKYSISVSSTSQETRSELGFHSTDSRLQLKGEIKKTPEILLLKYSREAGAQLKLARSNRWVSSWRRVKTKSLRVRDVATTGNRGPSSE
jgi:hypothetical protein